MENSVASACNQRKSGVAKALARRNQNHKWGSDHGVTNACMVSTTQQGDAIQLRKKKSLIPETSKGEPLREELNECDIFHVSDVATASYSMVLLVPIV